MAFTVFPQRFGHISKFLRFSSVVYFAIPLFLYVMGASIIGFLPKEIISFLPVQWNFANPKLAAFHSNQTLELFAWLSRHSR